uniref:Uncharacterized protein n=1 Tax=Eutreptiella gymnastica TaxID=73025 RepID=A0A7S1IB52_9EUGL
MKNSKKKQTPRELKQPPPAPPPPPANTHMCPYVHSLVCWVSTNSAPPPLPPTNAFFNNHLVFVLYCHTNPSFLAKKMLWSVLCTFVCAKTKEQDAKGLRFHWNMDVKGPQKIF